MTSKRATSPFNVTKSIALFDVTYVIEFPLDQRVEHLLPRQSINARFRTFVGDEGFEGHCEFTEGHYRAKRALLTIEEIADLIEDCGLSYVPEGVRVLDPGVDAHIELGSVLYFKAGGMYGYQALFVTLPKGHLESARNARIKALKDRIVPKGSTQR